MTSLAEVWLWGTRIGAVALEPGSPVASFEYDPAFLPSGIQLSPLHLPLVAGVHAFPALATDAYAGLPGLFAGALPGKFATTLVDAWLIAQDREPNSIDAVQRLLLVGERGTGALGFRPALSAASFTVEARTAPLDVAALARMVDRVQRHGRRAADGLVDEDEHAAFSQLVSVASTMRSDVPAAYVDCNLQTGEMRAGQNVQRAGHDPCVLEFDSLEIRADGTDGSRDTAALRHAYAMLARAAGIDVAETRIVKYREQRHLLKRRIDRSAHGKLHVHSFCAMDHLDPRSEQSVEQLFSVAKRLGLDMPDVEQMYARVVFQLLAHDRAAHFDDFAFTMNRRGQWSLAPARGFSYSTVPGFDSNAARMSLAGKFSGIETVDLGDLAASVSLPRGQALRIARRVRAALERWPEFAQESALGAEWTGCVQDGLLLDLVPIGS